MDARTASLWRPTVVLGGVVVVTALLVAPAWAHGRTTPATDYDSRIVEAPATEAVDWRVVGGDDLVVAEVHGDAEIVVLGYEGEPYLRLNSDGAWVNVASPANVLNDGRDGRVMLPEHVDADAAPQWRARSGGLAAYAWHDHRVHHARESGAGHQAIADHGEATRLGEWEIPVEVDGERAAVRGELWREPGPPAWPSLVGGLVLTAPAWLGVRALRGGAGVRAVRWPAGVIAVLAVANVAMVIDEVMAVPVPVREVAGAVGLGAITVVVAVLGVWRAWRGGRAAFVALAVAGGAIALGQGAGLWPALSASQLATLWPEAAVRALVGANVAVALPVAVVAAVGDRRIAAEGHAPPDADAVARS